MEVYLSLVADNDNLANLKEEDNVKLKESNPTEIDLKVYKFNS